MRLGINISDNLYKRMEPIKNMVNISLICRDAVEEWVNAYERSLQTAEKDELKETINSLIHASKSYDIDWEEIGRRDAADWAEKATPEQLTTFVHNMITGRKTKRTPGIWMAPVIPDASSFAERLSEHKQWFKNQFEKDWSINHYKVAEEEYERGWISCILAMLNLARKGSS